MNAIKDHDEIETLLRGELSARAESLAAGEAPYPAVRQAVRRDRARRAAGAASGLALVAVALITALSQTLTGASGTTVESASATGPSSLLAVPTRGNLATDSVFLAAMTSRLDTTSAASEHVAQGPGGGAANSALSILYANDDGTRRLVVAAAYNGHETLFTVFVGHHAASASALAADRTIGESKPFSTFTYVGTFAADGSPVPFAVLGPTTMTNIEYASGASIVDENGKLALTRTHITHVQTVDGTASGEIPGATSPAGAARLTTQTVFRGQIAGRHVDVDPGARETVGGTDPLGPTTAIKAAVAQRGRSAGLSMNATSPGGDAVPDNVAAVLMDLAKFDGVPLDSISYQVDWIGRETPKWDAALLDIHAPGIFAMQIFVRGLTAGAPDSDSPGLARTFVRPIPAVTPAHLPETASAFGGVPEPELFGYEVATAW